MTRLPFRVAALFVLSATVLSVEILGTRIASVIFASDYAFIILSLAVLGLSCGALIAQYRGPMRESAGLPRAITVSLAGFGVSLLLFALVVPLASLTSTLPFFLFLCLPFCCAGASYALIYRSFAEESFVLYAADLAGAAAGSLLTLMSFRWWGPTDTLLMLGLVQWLLVAALPWNGGQQRPRQALSAVIIAAIAFLGLYGSHGVVGAIPIRNVPEKDFYHVYDGTPTTPHIVESRWSVYGRSDLVTYSHQDMVRQLFIDGAAGTQMYRFNGSVRHPDPLLLNLLLQHSGAIPLLCLQKEERQSMLIVGPGGGKEVLMGLFSGVDSITGVEINPDFVEMVREHAEFNGGIYSNFPAVQISVGEARHAVKSTRKQYDLLVMSLPSTAQLQTIDAFAMNENFLVTTEAIDDYLRLLTPAGSLLITVHNRLELLRLIMTALDALQRQGMGAREAVNHFAIVETEYAPTLVIRKQEFPEAAVAHWEQVQRTIPREFPVLTFLPYRWGEVELRPSAVNGILASLATGRQSMQEVVDQYAYNITPCRDDSPYFYKATRGAPQEHVQLLAGIAAVVCMVAGVPALLFRKKVKREQRRTLFAILAIMVCTGTGFMMIEVSLFQKLVLFLGSPTIALSILLSSLLMGMGAGSYWARGIPAVKRQLYLVAMAAAIVIAGCAVYVVYPQILGALLSSGQFLRAVVCFVLMVPFGFLLGMPFPACLRILQESSLGNVIPWMYGMNGAASVMGSVGAVVLSMTFGFTAAFFAGVACYVLVGGIGFLSWRVFLKQG